LTNTDARPPLAPGSASTASCAWCCIRDGARRRGLWFCRV